MGTAKSAPAGELLPLLFSVSGFAALIYQIAWQRVLFTAFGVNIESITIIVAVFMFGLGVGSLVGGLLSHRFPRHLVQLFLSCEVLIGVFGLVSIPLIKAVSALTLHGSLFVIGATTYALLSIPTIFMGATLPILSAYLHQRDRNIGKAVSTLYFFNTLGSAIACFATADILFVFFGLQTTVMIAALCNFVVGILAFRYVSRAAPQAPAAAEPGDPRPDGAPVPPQAGQARLRLWLVLLLAAVGGYLALSQEILWLRAFAYATGDRPHVFAHVLGFLLIGIALGARYARRISDRAPDSSLTFVAAMLALSSLVSFLWLPVSGQILTMSEPAGLLGGFLCVGLGAFLLGAVFPALCHYAIRSGTSVGLPISWIYFANIVGSTAGPLLTGFVLLNTFTLEQNAVYLSVVGALLAVMVVLAAPVRGPAKVGLVAGLAVGMAALFFASDRLYAHVLEKLHYKTEYGLITPYKYVTQNRNGIIAVVQGDPDTVFGGGMYDGRLNLDPVNDCNRIRRPYLMAALHADPQDVLLIGLSSGSWARVLANHSRVRHLTIVEINPAYNELLTHYPEVGSLLDDPRVTIVIDDGRRWLNRHPDARFDVIVMNTTYHWRNEITNLVSDEFLHLCQTHLKPGGVFSYNSTRSDDIPYTTAQVFRYVTLYADYVCASDAPFALSKEQRRQSLLRFVSGGRPVFSESDPASRAVLEELAGYDLSDQGDDLRRKTGLWHITDDNMATEFKHPIR